MRLVAEVKSGHAVYVSQSQTVAHIIGEAATGALVAAKEGASSAAADYAFSTTTGFDEADVSQRVIHADGILYLVESNLKLRCDVKLTLRCYTHSCQLGSQGCGGGNADCDFQPRRRHKWTESGLSERQIEFKSFTLIVARNRTGSR
jgi:hypothetical protein